MAHYKKFNRAACGHMFKHYERAKDEGGEYIKFGNQDIDTNRTQQNYNLAPMHVNGQGGFVKERCGEVKMQNRKDVNVMCSWVVTAPKEIQAEETELFFRETYNFLSDRYGRENVVSAYVHMDESTPHMHFAFVPVVEDKKKNVLKVSAKEAVTRKDLEMFHQHFSRYMEKVFGRDVGVLNEATKDGNRSVEELKIGTAKKEYEELKQQTDEIKLECEERRKELKALENKKTGLENEIKAMEGKYKGQDLTAGRINRIKPERDFFGNIKNITMGDIDNLKRMAIEASKYRMALNEAGKELDRLKTENGELKTKLPTLKERMSVAEKEKALVEENKYLNGKLGGLKECLKLLPEEMYREFERIVNAYNDKERLGSEKNDMGYEYGD